jgi:hypothetical protein
MLHSIAIGYRVRSPAKKREAPAMYAWAQWAKQHFIALIFLCLLSFDQAKESD